MGEDKKSRRGDKSSKKVHTKLKKRKLREKEDDDDDDESQKVDQISSENDHDICLKREAKLKKRDKQNKRSNSILKKKRKKEKETEVCFDTIDELNDGDGGSSQKLKSGNALCNADGKEASQSEAQTKIENSIGSGEVLVRRLGTNPTDKSKKAGKCKKKNHLTSKKARKFVDHKTDVVEPQEIYHLSSGDDDCSKGMKKWLSEYHRSRPGLEILQQRIDEFITDHEAREGKERKEKEERAAEEGWTVVVSHKGKKRTTDSESGISVGSVAQAAVVDKMEKKKKKAIDLNFYTFQKREAQKNEVMMLQSKFEQDKKRIQQMRAARKFRPY